MRAHLGGRFGALRTPLVTGILSAGLAIAIVGGASSAQDASPMSSMDATSVAPASMVPADSTVEVSLADFTIVPAVIEATGPTVTFDVSNAGPTPHNLTIRDDAGVILGATPDLSTGETSVVTVTFPVAGSYITFCSLAGHESLGVKGTLVVADSTSMGSPAASPMASPPA